MPASQMDSSDFSLTQRKLSTGTRLVVFSNSKAMYMSKMFNTAAEGTGDVRGKQFSRALDLLGYLNTGSAMLAPATRVSV